MFTGSRYPEREQLPVALVEVSLHQQETDLRIVELLSVNSTSLYDLDVVSTGSSRVAVVQNDTTLCVPKPESLRSQMPSP